MSNSSLLSRLWPAVVAGLVGVAAALLAGSFTGVPLFADLVTEAATFFLGPRGFSFLLNELGPNGKPLLFLATIAGQFAVYSGVSFLLSARASAGPTPRISDRLPPFWLQAGLVTAIFIGISIALTSFGEAEIAARSSWPEYITLAAIVSLFYALSDRLYRTLLGEGAPIMEVSESSFDSRRSVLRLVVGGVVALGAVRIIGSRVVGTVGGGVQRSSRGQRTLPITSNKDFYLISKNLVDPGVSADGWNLRVTGRAERQVELSYADVLQIPSQEIVATLQCISNEVGGELISNASWTGFPLRTLIDQAGPLASAQYVAFRAFDGYAESLPLEFALRDEVMLVHSMNGETLPDRHGFPLRLITPGKYGIKNPKWLTEVILLDQEFFGYWQQRGWSQEAIMNTSCRIDSPTRSQIVGSTGLQQVHGIAFSGSRGISRVEVSTDGAQSWHDARLTPPLSPYSWVLWEYDWTDERTESRIEILARATDRTGEVQTSEERPQQPSGATGYPKVTVRVLKDPS